MYGIEWDICYVSDLPVAISTAKEVYSGNLIIDKLLREVDNALYTYGKNKAAFCMAYMRKVGMVL